MLSTNRTSAELRLPVDEGGYIIHVRATTDGGDGASSEPIRVPRITSKARGRVPGCSVPVATPRRRRVSAHAPPTSRRGGAKEVWGWGARPELCKSRRSINAGRQKI